MSNDLQFKIADQQSEIEQIHALNYETFVEEIPQHSGNSNRKLVDKFHHENTYLICLQSGELLGMVAVRDKRPFSLDNKLQNLDSYLPEHHSICEMRLLSIKRSKRRGRVIQGLFDMLHRYAKQMNYDLGVISANPFQQRLYNTIGFKPFGEVVGTEQAPYQPMYLTWDLLSGFSGESKTLNRETKFSVE